MKKITEAKPYRLPVPAETFEQHLSQKSPIWLLALALCLAKTEKPQDAATSRG